MSARRLMHAVERAVAEAGATLEWTGGSRHRYCRITLPNGGSFSYGISYGTHHDEMRTYKAVKGLLKKTALNRVYAR